MGASVRVRPALPDQPNRARSGHFWPRTVQISRQIGPSAPQKTEPAVA